MMPLTHLRAELRGAPPIIRLVFLPTLVLATCAASPGYAQTPMGTAGPPPIGAAPAPTTMPPASTVQGPPTLRLSGSSFSGSVDISETYATNAFGLGSAYTTANGGGDFITTLGLNLGAHDHTVRFDGDLQVRLVGDHYARNSSYDRVYGYLNALATAVLVPEHFFFYGSAFAAPILVNNLGPLGADGRPVATGPYTGTRDSYGYTISPDLKFRLGDFANSDTIVTQSSLFLVEPNAPTVTQTIPGQSPPTEFYSYGATQQLSSGIDFNRLNWILTGSWNKSTQSGLEFTQASGIGDLKFALNREVALLGTFGYQSFTSNQALIQSLVGPVALAGLQIILGPTFQADGRAGWRYNSPSYDGHLRSQPGPFTTLVASYDDTVTTPAGRLIGSTSQLGTDSQGGFINTTYQSNPNSPPPSIAGVTSFNSAPIDGLAINNSIVRYRMASASLLYLADRTQYRLTGFRTTYDTLTAVPSGIPLQSKSTGAEFGLSRTMTPRLTGRLRANYSVEDILGGEYNLYGGGLDLDYTVSLKTRTYLRVAYQRRDSNAALVAASPVSVSESDASIMIGLNRQF